MLRLRWKATVLGSILLVMVAPVVRADDNFLNFVQDGDTHHGAVVQTGSSDQAGTATLPVHQSGVFDYLILTQSGDNNTIGISGRGLLQSGTASIDGSAANSATVLQNSNDNTIGEVLQTTDGAHITTANLLTITQDVGDGNTIASVNQNEAVGASANGATLIQTGAHNQLDLVSQQATSAEGANRIFFKVTGDFNGTDQFAAATAGTLAIVARSTGASASRITQVSDLSGGADNNAWLVITGSYNQFGIDQLGVDNSVSASLTGLGNSFASYQTGLHNQVNSGGIAGDGNDIGLRQVGTDNAISASLQRSSGLNEVGVGQDGDDNTANVLLKGNQGIFAVSQVGRGHSTQIATTGDRNVVLAIVANSGAASAEGNTLNVSIAGDGNNGLIGGAPQRFSGAALSAAEMAPGVPASLMLAPDASLFLGPRFDGSGMVPGTLVQWGEGNAMTVNVGSTHASDSNLFVAAQIGNLNVLAAGINGDNNELVILELGNGNGASTAIDGTQNIVAISQ